MREQIAQLLSALAAQPGAETVGGLASVLQTYGGWGVASLFILVSAFLFKQYAEARDKNEKTLETYVKGSTDMVEENTKATVELKNALVNLTTALQAIERRLENVEKKSGS